MKKLIVICFAFLSVQLFAQPLPQHYYNVWQNDSLYYVLTDKAIFKYYSHQDSGQFFLTNFFEKKFTGNIPSVFIDDYFLFSSNDSIFILSNTDSFDFTLLNVFVPGYDVRSLHSFGPYFFIRTGDIYNLYKIVNNQVLMLEDSLFTHPPQYLVFFSYPFVIRAGTVYKYLEGFDFYAVTQFFVSNVNTAIVDNVIVSYFYTVDDLTWRENSVLFKRTIIEPYFPGFRFDDWGLNIIQLHHNFGSGTLIAKKNLYYMMWCPVITTENSQLAFVPTTNDYPVITDYYIFNLKDSLLFYSKWNAGSVFYPFTATNLMPVEENKLEVLNFTLFNNYPNPFNSATVISWSSPISTWQTLKIFDVLGKEITTLFNEYKPTGKYEIRFDAANLSSGIYYYQLVIGGSVLTKKMVVLK